MATDDPGRQPFAVSATATTSLGGAESGFADLGPVPSGKRLVVESVSVRLVVPSYVADHSGRCYLEPGGSVRLQVATVGGDGSALAYLSGYLLDV